jgi:site-specific recombinase XerC
VTTVADAGLGAAWAGTAAFWWTCRAQGALIRARRTLPRVIDPEEANAFVAALRTHRDRAMVDAMLLGGLRRYQVLGDLGEPSLDDHIGGCLGHQGRGVQRKRAELPVAVVACEIEGIARS